MPRKRNSIEARRRRSRLPKGGAVAPVQNPDGERVEIARQTRPSPVAVPHPLVAPLGITMYSQDVQDVWDTFVKPYQDGPQSMETRMLMAILRSMYTGLSEAEQGRVYGADQ